MSGSWPSSDAERFAGIETSRYRATVHHGSGWPGFRGCPFNNASVEFADPGHPARIVAREYRAELHQRLTVLASRIRPASGHELGDQLALLVDGIYANAAHLGADGPAAAGLAAALALLDAPGE